jgi:hypothetical protein
VRGPDDLAAIAGDHHVVVVAARADRDGAERGVALASSIADRDGRAPAVVLVLTDVGGTGGASSIPARHALGDRAVRTVPHDRALGAGDRSGGTDVRTAWSTLGAHLLALASEPQAALASGDGS